MTEQIEKTLIDGSWYDSETGEFLGVEHQAFTIKDDSSLEWVMERIFNAESAKSAEEAKLEALRANCERNIKRLNARVEGLRARFLPEIENYAKSRLDGKSKTVSNPFGKVSFRTKVGGLRVVDKEMALYFAQEHSFTEAIKVTEEFQISKLSDEHRKAIEDYYLKPGSNDTSVNSGFIIEPNKETCSLTTGVK